MYAVLETGYISGSFTILAAKVVKAKTKATLCLRKFSGYPKHCGVMRVNIQFIATNDPQLQVILFCISEFIQ
jgi:hypothetical protein